MPRAKRPPSLALEPKIMGTFGPMDQGCAGIVVVTPSTCGWKSVGLRPL